MKQLIMGLLFIVLAASLVFAAGEGGSGGTQTGPDAADGGSLGVGSETAGPDVTNKPEDAGNPEDTGNNSIQSTIRAETRVEERSGFTRFFAGGDEAAAEEIEKEVAANRARIAELAQLRETCPCDETTRALFQEQITTMAQEQERLGELVAKEKKSKGLLGWMWK